MLGEMPPPVYLDRRRELREALDLHREVGAPAGEAHSTQRLAEIRLLEGRRDEATRLLARALVLGRWTPMARHLLPRIHGTLIAVERPRTP